MICPFCFSDITKNATVCMRCQERIPLLYTQHYDRKPLIITPVGLSAHGKTVYLATLLYYLDRTVTRVWPRFYRQALDQTTAESVRWAYETLREGQLFPATQIVAPRTGIHLLSGIPGFNDRILLTCDAAGEVFTNETSIESYVRALPQSDVALLLISLADLEYYNSRLSDLLESYLLGLRRSGGRSGDQHLIVVYTKADLLQDEFGSYPEIIEYTAENDLDTLHDMDQYLTRMEEVSDRLEDFTSSLTDGPNFVSLSKQTFRSISYCAVSSLGSRPDEGNMITEVAPHRVIDPLIWALYRSDARPSRSISVLQGITHLLRGRGGVPQRGENRVRRFYKIWDDLESHLTQKDPDELIEFLEDALSLQRCGEKKREGQITSYTWDVESLLDGIALSNRVAVLVLTTSQVDENTLGAIRFFAQREHITDRALAVVLFGQAHRLARSVAFVNSTLRQVFALNVVILSRSSIPRIVASTDPRTAFKRLVLSQINLAAASPFTTTGPALDHAFFGRESEIRQVMQSISGDSFAIIGGRRVGKTSMLARLHHVRLPAAGLRTLYHDCSTTPTYDDFLVAPIRDWRPEPPPNAPATFGDLLQFPSDDQLLVLLLDEADKLVPADRTNQWRLFNVLRSLINSGRVQVVLGGERTLRDALRDATRP